jgi:ABC-type phosphate transport system permease subunit
MESKEPLAGPGRFQWNLGAWFGGQIGGTAWMLVGAVVLAPHAPEVAGVWLACFAVANAIGSWLWWCRDSLRPYPSLQALLSACGVSSVIALVALHVLRPDLRITRPRGILLTDEPRFIPWFLVLVIALMTSFHLMERSAVKERSRARGQTSP